MNDKPFLVRRSYSYYTPKDNIQDRAKDAFLAVLDSIKFHYMFHEEASLPAIMKVSINVDHMDWCLKIECYNEP